MLEECAAALDDVVGLFGSCVPTFCEVRNQIAANQVDNGVCERWKIVPAVAEVFNPHSAHIHRPAPVRQ